MQRIKFDVFKTLFEKNLTGNEIDFLIALTHMQDIRGEACGVHYREMTEAAGISVQAFYDCKKTLEEKGIIRAVQVQNDYDITFIGNDFSMYTDRDYKEGKVIYFSTNYEMFHDINWKKLKPKQKLLAMDLLNINMATFRTVGHFCAHKIGRKRFFEKYANKTDPDGTEHKGLLDISERTLQKYFKFLKLYFRIELQDGLYLILVREKFTEKKEMLEEDATYRRLIQAVCRRFRIREQDEKEEKGILNVLTSRREKITRSAVYIPDIFRKMIEGINGRIFAERKWKRRLKASLFNKLLTEELKCSVTA